ncbi:hypothetical protein F385_2936 [Pantoea agglomerans 299R]|nr:hypothetical protein F385_2936 [Pantoea agglomerans 299R]
MRWLPWRLTARGAVMLCAGTMKKGRFRGLFETLKFSQSLWV